ncbi:MAG: hypothetical protein QF473_14245 [Planctomycetota bacterium]|nr:hypothetical protein [Planctomycetota bacterium]MDP6504804.1 hypothetical protein [Planctomycetota bacterium]
METVLASEKAQSLAKQRKKRAAKESYVESDDYFAYIVGYTPGGAPFGITWEEVEADPQLKSDRFPDES